MKNTNLLISAFSLLILASNVFSSDCYERVYDKKHLSSNMNQQVTHSAVIIEDNEFVGKVASVFFRIRDSKKTYSGSGVVTNKKGYKEITLEEEDSGSGGLIIQPIKDSKDILLKVSERGADLWACIMLEDAETCDWNDNNGPAQLNLSQNKVDDKVFKLNSVSCEGLAEKYKNSPELF